MGIAEILASIDRDIAQLTRARTLLGGVAAARNRPGKPEKAAAGKTAKPAKTKKRVLSPEGRKRIADAQKKRWAARRKTAAGGS